MLAFAAGIAIGMNWPKIRKYLKPYMNKMGKKGAMAYASIIKQFAEQKEKLEDTLASAKATRIRKKVKAKPA